MRDDGDRLDPFEAQITGNRDAGPMIGVDADDERIPDFGRELQNAKVARVDDVEVARDKRNSLAGFQ